MSGAHRVLVTRPAGQCEALVDALTQQGFSVTAVPAIEIKPVDLSAASIDALTGTPKPDLLIFISRNAVRYGLPRLPARDDAAQKVAAVGPSTAKALSDAGWTCDITPEDGFTSEALLAHDALASLDEQRVVIVRGEGGRALLGDTLRARGAEVHYAEVYRRAVPPSAAHALNQAIANGIDIITVTSVETLANVHNLANKQNAALLTDVTLLTASERVLKKAQSLGYTQTPVLATAPDDAALTDALVRWRAERVATLPETETMATDTKETTDTDQDTANAPDESFDEQDHETPAPPSDEPLLAPPPPATPPAAPRGGRLLGVVAILIALGAAGAAGYTYLSAQRLASSADDPREALDAIAQDLRGDLDKVRQDVDDTAETLRSDVDRRVGRINLDPTNQRVDTLAGEVTDVATAQSALDRRVSGQKRAIDTVTDRLTEMESDLASLQGVSDTVRNTWVRAEAEYFLQTANSRLQLAGDVPSALSALRAADERIGALGDPGLIPIRSQITEEILAVESVPQPDIEGTAIALLGMSERVRELPLRVDEIPGNYEAPDQNETEAPSGWKRAADKVLNTMSGIVRVSPSNGVGVSVVAPEDAFFIYRNLELNLTIARLALIKQDQANYQGSIKTAREWLEQYFDTTRPGVRNMLERLADIEALEIDPEVPDISESLRMLRILVDKSSAS
ncbi:MAG: uroporphyrinogen-III C-methyltransferase [Pseudomonadota bacterium]